MCVLRRETDCFSHEKPLTAAQLAVKHQSFQKSGMNPSKKWLLGDSIEERWPWTQREE